MIILICYKRNNNYLYCFVFLSSAKSAPGVVRFLLHKGVKFVLTAKLNQDSLEQEFSKQRAACGANENPNTLVYNQNAKKLDVLKHHAIGSKNMCK